MDRVFINNAVFKEWLLLKNKALIMGILNITPDSFSDIVSYLAVQDNR